MVEHSAVNFHTNR